MCLQPGEEIGREMHPDVDQFFRIEQGEARFVLGENEEPLVRDEDAVVVPAGRTITSSIRRRRHRCGSIRSIRRRTTWMGRCT